MISEHLVADRFRQALQQAQEAVDLRLLRALEPVKDGAGRFLADDSHLLVGQGSTRVLLQF